jgi:hypothetical protein
MVVMMVRHSVQESLENYLIRAGRHEARQPNPKWITTKYFPVCMQLEQVYYCTRVY